MDLQAKLQEDMKAAMKAGQKDRLLIIRTLLSEVKNVGIVGTATSGEQAIEQYAKKLRKGAEEYEKLGKPDEATRFKNELSIVEEYLPKKASAEDTERLVNEFLAANTFTEKQLGQAMGKFMKEHGSKVDPGAANALLKHKLTGK